jgi:hypothetical protein
MTTCDNRQYNHLITEIFVGILATEGLGGDYQKWINENPL